MLHNNIIPSLFRQSSAAANRTATHYIYNTRARATKTPIRIAHLRVRTRRPETAHSQARECALATPKVRTRKRPPPQAPGNDMQT